MRKSLFALFILTLFSLNASAWGKKGHQVIAYIAKRHLTAEATDKLNKILDNNSIVYYASWLDQVVRDEEYSYTSTWHYLNVDEGQSYEERESLAYIDAVQALYKMSDVLRNPSSTPEELELAVKVIVHVVGDIHQPMHAGRAVDLGGNKLYVNYNGTRSKLHGFWDTTILEAAHNWSYYQWQQAIDKLSDAEAAAVMAGTIDDWAKESVCVATLVYDAFPDNAQVTDDDIAAWTPVVERQLLYGGLRLAALLNSLLSPMEAGLQSPTTSHTPQTTTPTYNLQGLPLPSYAPGLHIASPNHKFILATNR